MNSVLRNWRTTPPWSLLTAAGMMVLDDGIEDLIDWLSSMANVLKILDPEAAVAARYATAAKEVEPALCCAVSYPSQFLDVIPEEVLAKDYGCGDPTPYVRSGDTVLDLGAGAGKLAFILAQVVGPQGRVIGVDCNGQMLALARKYAPTVAVRLRYANVEFRNGLIQDLRLDLDRLAAELAKQPIRSLEDWLALRSTEDRLRRAQPLVSNASVDCVVSNCVLNLVRPQDRPQLFAEIFRVLRPGGRAAISDIVADQDVPEPLQNDPSLWSGCVSGAYREGRFLQAFEDAGFNGVHLAKRQSEPWQTVAGIEFRSVTVLARKSGEQRAECRGSRAESGAQRAESQRRERRPDEI